MDTLLQNLQNHPNSLYKLNFNNHQSLSAPSDENFVQGCQVDQNFADVSELPSEFSRFSNVTPYHGVQGDTEVECDYFDGVLRYINQMLNEEDLDDRPCMFQDCLALQAAEKSFYDVLNEDYPPPDRAIAQEAINPCDDFVCTLSNQELYSTTSANNHVQSYCVPDQGEVESLFADRSVINQQYFQSDSHTCYPSSLHDVVHGLVNLPVSPFQDPNSSTRTIQSNDDYVNHPLGSSEDTLRAAAGQGNTILGNPLIESRANGRDNIPKESGRNGSENSQNNSRNKNNHQLEVDDYREGPRIKHFASYDEEPQQTETYDKALLCPGMQPNFYHESSSVDSGETLENEPGKGKDYSESSKRGRPRKSEKGNSREVVDVRGVITLCAQAVSSYDSTTASELLKQIRQYSSPYGNATERVVHYFANALEARLNGTGQALYAAFTAKRASAADILKAYQTYVTACPFKRMSNIFANKSIARQTGKASKIHIIDFGILYGFQWPCLIHGISLRPGGPPKLRITGIDFPQAGFRPAERIEKTGERLANYCKRFNVPFEYTAIAKKWDSITPEDLKIDRDEMLVVNCLYRLRHVPDESLTDNSPRDTVLDLIKKINPDFFVLGGLNGTYNAPFFATRFREALYHFSCLFDMYEATVPREDQDRLLFEREVFGRDIMNIIACEGTERVERPETYKQWQFRNQRAGFRQLPVNQNIMKEVRAKVGWSYHRDFLLDQDSNWMLQGWKGRVIYALSCWKPLDK